MTTVPQQALDIIRQFEGCKLEAYQDIGGVWTVGWGCTSPDITQGTIWTQEQADSALFARAQESYDNVCALAIVSLNDNQASALTDWVYNLGVQAFINSTLLMYIKANQFSEVPNQIMRWVHVEGVIVKGLINRRNAEVCLWLANPQMPATQDA